MDGSATEAARLNWPRGISVGPDGEIWVADSGNNSVRVVRPEGWSEGAIGSLGSEPAVDAEAAARAEREAADRAFDAAVARKVERVTASARQVGPSTLLPTPRAMPSLLPSPRGAQTSKSVKVTVKTTGNGVNPRSARATEARRSAWPQALTGSDAACVDGKFLEGSSDGARTTLTADEVTPPRLLFQHTVWDL